MAQYNFEGNIDGINERQLEFISTVIEEHGFKGSKVTIEPVGKAGDNYVAIVKRIIIEGADSTLKIIAKIAPSMELLRASMNAFMLFKNEHIMYTEVLPKLLQPQKDADVPEGGHLRFAKCYGSLREEPNEVILLEDLNTSEYVMLDRLESLSNECVSSVLKNFGKLHSLSHVLKKKEPETYEYFKANLKEVWSNLAVNPETMQYFQQLENNALEVLEDPEHKNIVRHKVADMVTYSVKLTKFDKDNKHSIIQQGDSWTNNIMFRFEDGALKDSVMIDYQLSKVGSPVYDLLYMIMNCTDHEMRSKHFYDWIDQYHSELDKSLSHFGLKANFVYPRDQLDADLKRYSKLLFGLSIMLSSALTMTSEDASKLKETMDGANMGEITEGMKITAFNNESVTRYRNRIIGLIETYNKFGLL